MLFWAITLKNVLRRKVRTLLTAVALIVSVAATTALLSIAWGYADSVHDHYASRNVDIVVVRAGVAQRITSSLNADLVTRLRGLPGVANVDGSLMEMVSLGEGSLIGIPLHGLDPTGFALSRYVITQGLPLKASDENSVLLGAGLAAAIKKSPGTQVEIEGTQFTVAGLFQGADALESNTAVTSLKDLQTLTDRPRQVSEFQIELAPPATVAKVRDVCQLLEALQDDDGNALGLKAIPARDFAQSDTETGLLGGMAVGTSAIAICLSTLGVLNTMLMSVLERTREFGVLRAIGWSRRRVIRLILSESLVICVTSAALGVLAAGATVRLLAAWPFTSNLVPPYLLPAAVAMGLAIGIGGGLAGAIYPAVWASAIDPTEALHYE